MKNIIIITLALLLSSFNAWAQPTHGRSLKSIKQAASQASADHNYFEALKLYQEAYSKYKDASLLLAMSQMNYQLRDYEQVIALTEQSIKADKDTMSPQDYVQYARSLKAMGQYEKAIKYFDQAINKTSDNALKSQLQLDKKGALMAENMSSSKEVLVSNMGSNINSGNSEYAALRSANGDLYFSAITAIDPAADNATGKQAQIFKLSNSVRAKPKALGKQINAAGYYHPSFALSADGETMVFTRQRLDKGNQVIESKLYSAQLSNGKWTNVKQLPIGKDGDRVKSPNIANINGQQVLLYVSDAASGAGGYDIYMTDMDSYVSESSLGDMINTDRDEESPFVKDGILYFSSKGHAGVGGFDIFSYEIGSDDMPKNMAYPYNSSADDIYFSMSDDYTGMLASNRIDSKANSLKGQTCCNDLYTVTVAKLELAVDVQDALSGAAIADGSVQLLTADGQELKPTMANGKYVYLLASDQEYQLKVTKDGYEPYMMPVSTMNIYTTTMLEERVSLDPIPEPEPEEVVTIEKPIVLENILYEFDSDRFVAGSEKDLNYLLQMLNEYPSMQIKITSHTDSKGKASYNQKLSERRATAVTRWLTNKGIAAERLTAVGKGEAQAITVTPAHAAAHSFLPVGTVLDDAFVKSLPKAQRDIAHQLNRRSDFSITAGPKNIKIVKKP